MKENEYTVDGVNKNTFDLIFNDKCKCDRECSKEIRTIELSSVPEKKIILKLYRPLIKLLEMYFDDVNFFNIRKRILTKGFQFKNKNQKFEFYYLEKYLKKILKNEDTYVKKELIWEMKNNFRHGTCYKTNMILSYNIKDSFLVTGLILMEDGSTYKHAYVEYKDYIIDFTKNLIIKKDKYYELLKVKELGKIKSEDISMIFNVLNDNQILSTTRYMALFGNEIIADLMKNKFMLKESSFEEPDFSLFYQF